QPGGRLRSPPAQASRHDRAEILVYVAERSRGRHLAKRKVSVSRCSYRFSVTVPCDSSAPFRCWSGNACYSAKKRALRRGLPLFTDSCKSPALNLASTQLPPL